MIRYFRILVLLTAYVLVHPEPAMGQVEPPPAGADVVFGAGAGLSHLSTHNRRGAVGPEVKMHAELPLNDWIAAGVQAGFSYRREEKCPTIPEGTDCSREGVFRPGAALRLRAGRRGSEAAVAVGLHGRGLRRYAEISYAVTLLRSELSNVGVEGLWRASPFGTELGILIRFTPNLGKMRFRARRERRRGIPRGHRQTQAFRLPLASVPDGPRVVVPWIGRAVAQAVRADRDGMGMALAPAHIQLVAVSAELRHDA